MTELTRTGAWEVFLKGAAHVCGHPRFEAEERDRKLQIASGLRSLMDAARRGEQSGRDLGDLLLSLGDPGLPSPFLSPKQAERLRAWAVSEDESLGEALAAFVSSEEDPVARFARFARATGEQGDVRGLDQRPRLVVLLGSMLNFALDPRSLPIIPPQFERIEQKLGWHAATGALAEQYENHLAFARKVEDEMRRAAVPVQDMIDVQSLISLFSDREVLWEVWSSRSPSQEPIAEKSPRPRGTGPYLSVGACIGQATPYLLEWIEFHRLVGVERFFLYNNRDRDAQRELLAPYVEDGIVTLYEWPIVPPQVPAYEHCLEEHGEDSRWIAFIDTDEFLFSPTESSLPEVLVDYERWPGIGVNWVTFGPSGHHSKPPGLVIESYLSKASDSGLGLYARGHVKSIVDPRRTVGTPSVHGFAYDQGFAVDENGYPVVGAATPYESTSRLRINHYFTRSVTEFLAKMATPQPDQWSARAKFDLEQILSDEKTYGRRDTAILRYVPALREALEKVTPRTLDNSPSSAD